jgi:hypothetical protein
MIGVLFEIVNSVSKVASHERLETESLLAACRNACTAVLHEQHRLDADRTQTGKTVRRSTPPSVLHCIADRTQTKHKIRRPTAAGKMFTTRGLRSFAPEGRLLPTLPLQYTPDTDGFDIAGADGS